MKKLFYLMPILLLIPFAGKSNPLNGPTSASEQIRMNLYGFYPDGSTYTLDGTLTRYSDSYSNDIDINDSRKMYNSGENISMPRGGYDLIVECRHTIASTDTIFFRMWNMQKKSYRMEFVARNLDHPGLEGYLEDTYLHTSSAIPLNDTTRFTITINDDPGSYAQDRFRLIFNTPAPALPPVPHFTSLNASEMNSNILISWNALNQNNIKQYFVEKSQDGSHFSDVASIPSVNSTGIYNWTDHYPGNQINYYRLREEEVNGNVDYTATITVKNTDYKGIFLYPNPASAGNVNVRFANQAPGTYYIMLINSAGHILSHETYFYQGGTGFKKLSINPGIPAGVYHVQVSDGGIHQVVLSVVL